MLYPLSVAENLLNFFRTTGLPKGVEISHYNLVSNSFQLLFKRAIVGKTPAAQARKERLDLSGERWLAPLPMYHAYVSPTSEPFPTDRTVWLIC
jgi:acyl-CoA synthetase (AMP-forming)/AMP-acid ligase II